MKIWSNSSWAICWKRNWIPWELPCASVKSCTCQLMIYRHSVKRPRIASLVSHPIPLYHNSQLESSFALGHQGPNASDLSVSHLALIGSLMSTGTACYAGWYDVIACAVNAFCLFDWIIRFLSNFIYPLLFIICDLLIYVSWVHQSNVVGPLALIKRKTFMWRLCSPLHQWDLNYYLS